ncbi:MAG: hypothetical protein GY832_27845 [Chloroflexi bacterium]|nr:hypothetical protein [Chloroflexota bacterium]
MNNKHMTAWLGAYHDGELRGLRLQKVEAHLAHCEVCRAELAELQALTTLLQISPAPETLLQPDRFAAQVGLRLSRRPAQPTWRRALEVGWRLTPVGLLGTLVFVQAALLVSGVILRALQFGLGSDVIASWLPATQQGSWLTTALNLSSVNLNGLAQMASQLLSNGGPLGWGLMLNLASIVVIGLLYLSWMASWWARQQHNSKETITE